MSSTAQAEETSPPPGGSETTDAEVIYVVDQLAPASAPDAADNVRVSPEVVVGRESGTLTRLPSDVEDPIAFVTESGIASTIGLPDNADLDEDGVVHPDGTVTFSGDEFGLATRTAEGGGVQTMITLSGPEAPTEYHFDLGVPQGTTYEFLPDGSFRAVLSDGTVVGGLSAPWAFDAAGSRVPTHYVVTDDGVTQIVDHASGSFVYPILADPCWSCFLDGIAAAAGVVIGIAGVAGACALACKIGRAHV